MRIKYFIFYLFAATIFFTSCAPTIEPPGDFGYNYIPIDTGRYYIYDVDSICINLDATPHQNDTFHYQMKEFYPYRFLDANNDTVVCCTRFYRNADTLSWTPISSNVWWIRRTTTRFEKTEENLTYVKMTYPIDGNYTWNGNAYNILAPQDYEYGQMDIALNNGFATFDSTITVYQQTDTTNVIQYYLHTESYARNIGMVLQKRFDIEKVILNDTFDHGSDPAHSGWEYIPPPLHWYNVYILNRIQKGTIVTYKLIDHGFE